MLGSWHFWVSCPKAKTHTGGWTSSPSGLHRRKCLRAHPLSNALVTCLPPVLAGYRSLVQPELLSPPSPFKSHSTFLALTLLQTPAETPSLFSVLPSPHPHTRCSCPSLGALTICCLTLRQYFPSSLLESPGLSLVILPWAPRPQDTGLGGHPWGRKPGSPRASFQQICTSFLPFLLNNTAHLRSPTRPCPIPSALPARSKTNEQLFTASPFYSLSGSLSGHRTDKDNAGGRSEGG